jgi:DNA polymerase III epsilon subunit family exonuclease
MPPAPVKPAGHWVVFDLETTGLHPDADDIIQIAAVRMLDGRRTDTDSFFSYVRPTRPIPPFISNYTGVTNEQVRQAPAAADVLRDFGRFVGNSTLVAHNGHRFDMKFLEAVCSRYSTSYRPIAYHDSLGLSRQLWGYQGVRHSLDAVLQRLGLADHQQQRHDARADVDLLSRAIELMWQRLAQTDRFEIRCYEGRLPCD